MEEDFVCDGDVSLERTPMSLGVTRSPTIGRNTSFRRPLPNGVLRKIRNRDKSRNNTPSSQSLDQGLLEERNDGRSQSGNHLGNPSNVDRTKGNDDSISRDRNGGILSESTSFSLNDLNEISGNIINHNNHISTVADNTYSNTVGNADTDTSSHAGNSELNEDKNNVKLDHDHNNNSNSNNRNHNKNGDDHELVDDLVTSAQLGQYLLEKKTELETEVFELNQILNEKTALMNVLKEENQQLQKHMEKFTEQQELSTQHYLDLSEELSELRLTLNRNEKNMKATELENRRLLNEIKYLQDYVQKLESSAQSKNKTIDDLKERLELYSKSEKSLTDVRSIRSISESMDEEYADFTFGCLSNDKEIQDRIEEERQVHENNIREIQNELSVATNEIVQAYSLVDDLSKQIQEYKNLLKESEKKFLELEKCFKNSEEENEKRDVQKKQRVSLHQEIQTDVQIKKTTTNHIDNNNDKENNKIISNLKYEKESLYEQVAQLTKELTEHKMKPDITGISKSENDASLLECLDAALKEGSHMITQINLNQCLQDDESSKKSDDFSSGIARVVLEFLENLSLSSSELIKTLPETISSTDLSRLVMHKIKEISCFSQLVADTIHCASYLSSFPLPSTEEGKEPEVMGSLVFSFAKEALDFLTFVGKTIKKATNISEREDTEEKDEPQNNSNNMEEYEYLEKSIFVLVANLEVYLSEQDKNKQKNKKVEQEMKSTAQSVSQSALRIEKLLQESKKLEPGIMYDVNESILMSSIDLMNSVKELIDIASILQRHIALHNNKINLNNKEKSEKDSNPKSSYMKNNRWGEGLISAAKAVAWCANVLVNSVDETLTLIQSKNPERKVEMLIVASKEVVASTAQLVTSYWAKIKKLQSKITAEDQNNSNVDDSDTKQDEEENKKKLEFASKTVNEKVKILVSSVTNSIAILEKKEKEEKEEQANNEGKTINNNKYDMSAMQQKRLEMEVQVRILQIEGELEKQRAKLSDMRKSQYIQKKTTSKKR